MLRIHKIIPAEVQADLQKLTVAAKSINELSDELTREVAGIEAVVNRLNLGVHTNVQIEKWFDEEGRHSGVWRLAYGKEAGKWGFFIEYIATDEDGLRQGDPNAETYESWLFKDAPRENRIKAVGKIPLLLQALVKASNEVAAKIAEEIAAARELASAIAQPALVGSGK
jgi:hypothetical protein